jgi:asparagine synthetase B (glutamine-hydrolysing)
MHDDAEGLHAIVNGEFYDYASLRHDLEAVGCTFRTSCDSELVLHLSVFAHISFQTGSPALRYKVYGQNLLFHLRGEFAFVLYDSKHDLLFAGRDRFGIKPLYYTLDKGRLLLASEMKALPAFGWKPEWGMESIVSMGEYCDDRTVFEGVYKVTKPMTPLIEASHLP